jgi:hypothetical protein
MAQETIFYSPIRAHTIVAAAAACANAHVLRERERWGVGEDEDEEEEGMIVSMCHLYIFSFHHWAIHDRSQYFY